MKTSDSLLTESDVAPFYKQKVVVRLYKRQRWFAGFCWKMRFSDTPDKPSRMWLDSYALLGLGHEALAIYPDQCLFSLHDSILPGTIRFDERPFELIDCRQVFTKRPQPELLICSCSDGALIMSVRREDVRMAQEHLGLRPVDIFDSHIRLH